MQVRKAFNHKRAFELHDPDPVRHQSEKSDLALDPVSKWSRSSSRRESNFVSLFFFRFFCMTTNYAPEVESAFPITCCGDAATHSTAKGLSDVAPPWVAV
jgi:hypothetical protein